MKIYVATDHAGFHLKEFVKGYLQKAGYKVVDCGAYTFDKNDDFTDFIAKAARAVSKDTESRAVIFGGSGQGEAMLANKYKNVRATVFYGPYAPLGEIDATGKTSSNRFEIIKLSRAHNDANVLSFGARFVTEADVSKALDIWLTTPFSGQERHKRRIDKISKIESGIRD